MIKKIMEKIEIKNDDSILLGLDLLNDFINDDITSNINK
jgi:hypothetical protein